MIFHTPGNYRKNHSIIKFAKSAIETDLTVVFIHGLYGTAGDRGSKSYILGEKIRRLGVANVAYLNSSRDWKIYKSGDEKKAFCEKTFDEERRDILDIFRVLSERAPEVLRAAKALSNRGEFYGRHYGEHAARGFLTRRENCLVRFGHRL